SRKGAGMVRELNFGRDEDGAVRVRLAGVMAEIMALFPWDRRSSLGAHDDLQKVGEYVARRVDRLKRVAFLDWNIEATEQTLNAEWAAVCSIAERLEKDGKVVRDQAVRLCDESGANRVRRPPE